MLNSNQLSGQESTDSMRARAIGLYLRRESEDWTDDDEESLARWIQDPTFARVYAQVTASLRCVDRHLEAPELQSLRRAVVKKATLKNFTILRRFGGFNLVKWSIAAGVVIATGVLAYEYGQFQTISEYHTAAGEQRTLRLDDESQIAMDSDTSIKISFTRDSRTVSLVQGQAQFVVAPDARRPFRVEAGDNTVTAIGTSFNVDYFRQVMGVTMLEGKVGVSTKAIGEANSDNAAFAPSVRFNTTDLVAGQALWVDAAGQVEVDKQVDVSAVIAWRQGKLVFKGTPLKEAIQRVNRYSKIQILVSDDALASLLVSGIFDSGDTQGFVEAVQVSMSVSAVMEGPTVIRLSMIR